MTYKSFGPGADIKYLTKISPAIPVLDGVKKNITWQIFTLLTRGTKHTVPAAEKDISKLTQLIVRDKWYREKRRKMKNPKNKAPDHASEGLIVLGEKGAAERWWRARTFERETKEKWQDSEATTAADTQATNMSATAGHVTEGGTSGVEVDEGQNIEVPGDEEEVEEDYAGADSEADDDDVGSRRLRDTDGGADWTMDLSDDDVDTRGVSQGETNVDGSISFESDDLEDEGDLDSESEEVDSLVQSESDGQAEEDVQGGGDDLDNEDTVEESINWLVGYTSDEGDEITYDLEDERGSSAV